MLFEVIHTNRKQLLRINKHQNYVAVNWLLEKDNKIFCKNGVTRQNLMQKFSAEIQGLTLRLDSLKLTHTKIWEHGNKF